MLQLELEAAPNQAFSTVLDGLLYDIEIKETNKVMSVSITRSGIPLVSNMRVVNSIPLLPYIYLQKGNFIFYASNDDIIYYDQFGITQFLLYATQAEIGALLQ